MSSVMWGAVYFGQQVLCVGAVFYGAWVDVNKFRFICQLLNKLGYFIAGKVDDILFLLLLQP